MNERRGEHPWDRRRRPAYTAGHYPGDHDVLAGTRYPAGRLDHEEPFFRALHNAGLALHELAWTRLNYARDGDMAGYFYRDVDAVVVVYWLAEEIAPAVERPIARYEDAKK